MIHEVLTELLYFKSILHIWKTWEGIGYILVFLGRNVDRDKRKIVVNDVHILGQIIIRLFLGSFI